MIKAAAWNDNGPILILGLSGENMTRLMAGEPIALETQQLHPALPPLKICILGGRTEEDITEIIKNLNIL